MKYKLSLPINKPINEVTRLYANRALLHQWQPEFQDSKQIENFPKPKFTHQIALGRRTMVMTETILGDEMPNRYDVLFELKGVTHTLNNTFHSTDDGQTQWNCTFNYRFKGIMKIISVFSKNSLKKQSEIMMINFKRFAESRK